LAFLGIALFAHQFLLWLGKDVFAARLQAILFLLLALAGPGRIWPRVALFAFGALALFIEGPVLSLEIFQKLHLPWPDPAADRLLLAYEEVMGQAAIYSGGGWGLGLDYWSRLEFPRHGPIAAYTLPYLAVWVGFNGTCVYLLLQSTFLSSLSFESQKLKANWAKAIVWPLSCLLIVNLALTVLASAGSVGRYDPIGVAFAGSPQVGALALGLVYFCGVFKKYGDTALALSQNGDKAIDAEGQNAGQTEARIDSRANGDAARDVASPAADQEDQAESLKDSRPADQI
jgi:hypothetical protein